MKVIFLDVDGVLNNRKTLINARTDRDMVCLDKVRILKEIVDKTSSLIVLSSSWRLLAVSLESITTILSENGIEIFSRTPNFKEIDQLGNKIFFDKRMDEISTWLDDHPDVYGFVVIDDDTDAWDGDELFLTSFEDGLTDEIGDKIVKFLEN